MRVAVLYSVQWTYLLFQFFSVPFLLEMPHLPGFQVSLLTWLPEAESRTNEQVTGGTSTVFRKVSSDQDDVADIREIIILWNDYETLSAQAVQPTFCVCCMFPRNACFPHSARRISWQQVGLYPEITCVVWLHFSFGFPPLTYVLSIVRSCYFTTKSPDMPFEFCPWRHFLFCWAFLSDSAFATEDSYAPIVVSF